MKETRKKGSGFEDVKRYVLERCAGTGVAKITTAEIGSAVGISPQAAHKHLQTLLSLGVISSVLRSVYTVDAAHQVDGKLMGSLREVDGKLIKCDYDPTPNAHQVDGKLMGSLREVDGKLIKCAKTDIQEKKEERERNMDCLGDVLKEAGLMETYRELHRVVTAMFNKYSAGVRRGTDPHLINRIAAGIVLKIPLLTLDDLENELKEAEKRFLIYESFSGYGKREGIRKPFVHIAAYAEACFRADGWTWTKLKPPLQQRLKSAHKNRKTSPTPFFSEIRQEIVAITQESALESVTPPAKPVENMAIASTDVDALCNQIGRPVEYHNHQPEKGIS